MRSPQETLATMYSNGALSAFTGIILTGDEAAARALTLLGKLNPNADAIEQAAAILEYHRGNIEEAYQRWDLGLCQDCSKTVREDINPGIARCTCSNMDGIACRLSDRDVILEDL